MSSKYSFPKSSFKSSAKIIMNQLNRSVPTKQEQLQNLWTHKFIYCNHRKYLQWIEDENIEMIEEYDEYLSILPSEMIPIRICGIRGDEFEDYKGVSEIKISPNMVKIITIEEQQILLDGYSINEEYIAHV